MFFYVVNNRPKAPNIEKFMNSVLTLWRKSIIPLRVAKNGIHFLFQAEAKRQIKMFIE